MTNQNSLTGILTQGLQNRHSHRGDYFWFISVAFT